LLPPEFTSVCNQVALKVRSIKLRGGIKRMKVKGKKIEVKEMLRTE
jgi:hypothetical protein